jgi:hypothetical protein
MIFPNHSLNFSEVITVGGGGVGGWMRAMRYIWIEIGHIQERLFVDQLKGFASEAIPF